MAGVRVGHGDKRLTAIESVRAFLIPSGFSKVSMMSGFGWFRGGPPTSGPASAPVSEKPWPGACFHCGLPLPAPVADWVEFEGKPRPLCCASCLAAAEMLIGNGFVAYYSDRDA